jgi:ParB family chromosome partitioning protein
VPALVATPTIATRSCSPSSRTSRESSCRRSRRPRVRALVDEFGLTLGGVRERVGRSKSSVSNRLRLLELPDEVLWMLVRGELTEGHAAPVLRFQTPRSEGARCGGSCGRPVGPRGRARCAGCGREAKRGASRAGRSGARSRVETAATRVTGMAARVTGGRLEIAFADETELEELAEALERVSDGRSPPTTE